MAESTASSVTKNRIKTNYHGALEGFNGLYKIKAGNKI